MVIMRLRTVKRLVVLGTLVCVASIGTGCSQLSKPGFPGNSGSNTRTTPVASPRNQEFTGLNSGVDKKPAASLLPQNTRSGEWLLQPGLFGVQHGMWLGWISFAIGFFGTSLTLFVHIRLVRQLESELSLYDKNLKMAHADIKLLSIRIGEYSNDLDRLKSSYQQIQDSQAGILGSINNLRVQQKPEPQSYAIPAPSLISIPLVASQPSAPSPAQKQAELTAAVNRGDRQVVKSETRVQLNITHASENAISMGRLNETQLEEVSAGGSYWAASFAGETWLYPTEQTLKGYSQSQRPTGIFNYSRQPIPTAQVISPARLTLSGTLWQVVEMGSIAVPG